MFRPRIIPVLLYKTGGLYKSIRFKDHKYIGDPINAVRIFNDCLADEIIILDIEASKKGSVIDVELVKEVGEEANMPFSVGGGINTLDQIYERLRMGAEKVILNAAALHRYDFIKDAADHFGSSTIAVCVDLKKNLLGRYQVFSHATNKNISTPWRDHLKNVEDAGAGEIIMQSVDRDGLMSGYEVDLYKSIAADLSVPVVALGGSGMLSDMSLLWNSCPINAMAAGSQFVYHDKNRGVLINYPNNLRDEFCSKL